MKCTHIPLLESLAGFFSFLKRFNNLSPGWRLFLMDEFKIITTHVYRSYICSRILLMLQQQKRLDMTNFSDMLYSLDCFTFADLFPPRPPPASPRTWWCLGLGRQWLPLQWRLSWLKGIPSPAALFFYWLAIIKVK